MYYLSKIIYYKCMFDFFRKKKKHVSSKTYVTREKSKYTITQDIRHINAATKIQSFIRKRLTVCSICCENFIQNKYHVLLKCNHMFHISCYNKLYNYNYTSCPNCRKDIIPTESRSISLVEMLTENPDDIRLAIIRISDVLYQNRRQTIVEL